MNLTEDLKARGIVEHTSAPLEAILSKKHKVYFGSDPTADSLHVGHLVPLMLMRRLASAGHQLTLLVGGGTGMIGDPREKGERPLLDKKIIQSNKKALKLQMQRIIGAKVEMVDNADWLLKVNLVDFLRDIGKHFTINELVKRDLIKRRLDNPDDSISYTEFAYSLLQGYDFLELYKKKNIDLQVGGTDQWLNILSGVELIRRKLGKEAFAITTPMVTDSTGKKFSKSEGKAIWLDAKKTSPFKFYQFWVNQPDTDVEKYLKLYTFLSIIEIEALVEMHRRNPGARQAQEMLARLVTEIVHGKDATEHATKASRALFGNESLATLSKADIDVLLAETPSTTILTAALEQTSIVEVLVTGSLAPSKGEARRLIEGKGVSLNGVSVGGVDQKLTPNDFSNGLAFITKGKRDTLLLVLK